MLLTYKNCHTLFINMLHLFTCLDNNFCIYNFVLEMMVYVN